MTNLLRLRGLLPNSRLWSSVQGRVKLFPSGILLAGQRSHPDHAHWGRLLRKGFHDSSRGGQVEHLHLAEAREVEAGDLAVIVRHEIPVRS